MKTPVGSRFKLEPIDENAISKIIDDLKPKTSFGIDRVSNKLLKYVKKEITPLLTQVINHCLNTGIFPDALKVAKVLPIYKKDDDKIFGNYRLVI